ncbi:MAG TPA: alpha-amylase family protein [Jiangellales bacterium]|nr:alpha-amylase family protein [Jiangellales bacterium]
MRITDTADLWWKNAVVYCLDVETFYDADSDGVGDFQGLAHRVDYLADLGVTCIWLMPFYPTANKDDGYDVTDFYSVDDRLGTLGDFVEFIRTAQDRGLRVIADLVVNHTSAHHPWFESSRDPDSPYRDWYVWRDTPPEDGPEGEVFPGDQEGLWEYDEEAEAYYLHRFYKHQPDLNVTNPAVRDEIAKILGFWMQLGLHGFRVDAVPFFLETSGVDGGMQKLPDPHGYLRDLRAYLSRRRGDGVLLGEVNLPHEEQMAFFGDEDGDELNLLFDFPTMQAMYLSMARGDAGPLRTTLVNRPESPADCQWATFVRNHDELTLDKLSGSERQEVFAAFGPDKDMQLYDRGLRRRLPPMVKGDQRRIRLAYSLLFSLPGTPTLFYGEEIGMGENLDVPDRLAVRTPMQWMSGPGAGFSDFEDPERLVRPLVEGDFGPDRVNALDQRRDRDSLLHWMRVMIRRYRELPELAWGSTSVLDHDVASVLVHRSDWEGQSVLLAHNLAGARRSVTVTLPDAQEEGYFLRDLLDGGRELPVGERGGVDLDLAPYGFAWYRLVREGDRRLL